MASDLLTMTQAADRQNLDCSRQWVHYLITTGKLKAELVGGVYILKTKHVEAYKAAHPPKKKKRKR